MHRQVATWGNMHMGWTAQPRWGQRHKCYRAGVDGTRHSLGRDYAYACKRFGKIIAGHGAEGPPEFVPELVEQWHGECSDWTRYISNQWPAFESCNKDC